MEDLDKNKKQKELNSLNIIVKTGQDIFDEKSNTIENKIIKYIRENKIGTEDKKQKLDIDFYLMKKIKELEYYFSLVQDVDKNGDFYFSFDTKYEYAKTNLNKEQKDDLFKTIESFFDSVSKDQKDNLKRIWMTLSEVNYTAEEIDSCINKILEIDKSKTKEELLKSGINKIFELYKNLYKKDFEYTKNSKKAYYRRMQIFEEYLNYFKNWNCIQEENKEADKLILVRK